MSDPQTLASYDDVVSYVQDNTLDYFTTQQALEVATAIVQAETRQHLFFVEADVVAVPWPREAFIELPERPITAVRSISARPGFGPPYPLASTSWQLIDSGRAALMSPWDLPANTYAGAALVVTYDHGWAAIPADLRAVCIGLAVRTLHNPSERLSEALEAYQQPASTAGPAGLTNAERILLRRYRTTTYAVR